MLIGRREARRRRDPRGSEREARLRRSVAPGAQRQEHGVAGDLRRTRSHQGRQLRDLIARLCRPLQFQGRAAAADDRRSVGRRAQSRAPGQGAEVPAATSCCSTNRPTISTSRRCARSRMRWWLSRAARWSSRTIAGSSTASRRTSSPSRATREVVWFEGNYQEYVEDLKRRRGDDAAQPHRLKYRKLTH